MKENRFLTSLSLVIPVFNEEERIKHSLQRVIPYLESSLRDYEVIFVDDGSTDKTVEVIKQFRNKKFRILTNKENCGKGYSVRKGILNSKLPFILFSDADFSTPIEDLEKMLPFVQEYDVIIGSRAMKDSQIAVHQSFYKELLGRMGNKLIQLLVVPGIKDTQCGFKLFKRGALAVFEKQTVNRWGFDFEILMLASKMNFKIKEVPVRWKNDFRSKVKRSDYLKTLAELLKIKWNILINKYDLKNHG